MTGKDYGERIARLGLGDVLGPVLAVITPSVVAVLMFSKNLGVDNAWASSPDFLAQWKEGLLFVSCTVAVILFQVFFNQYFDLQLQKKILIDKLREDQADEIRLIGALSRHIADSQSPLKDGAPESSAGFKVRG